MQRIWIALLTLGALACAPELNWRDVTSPSGVLSAMLPCKPDRGGRPVQLGAQSYQLDVMGCEAGGATYALSELLVREPAQAREVQALWQAYLQQSLRAEPGERRGSAVKGADEQILPPIQWQAIGTMPDGRRMAVQALWVARGDRLYHGIIQAPAISKEMSEPFFGAMVLR